MLPNPDIFVGKQIKWGEFQENLDFYLKRYHVRYTMSGVNIVGVKNVKAVHKY